MRVEMHASICSFLQLLPLCKHVFARVCVSFASFSSDILSFSFVFYLAMALASGGSRKKHENYSSTEEEDSEDEDFQHSQRSNHSYDSHQDSEFPEDYSGEHITQAEAIAELGEGLLEEETHHCHQPKKQLRINKFKRPKSKSKKKKTLCISVPDSTHQTHTPEDTQHLSNLQHHRKYLRETSHEMATQRMTKNSAKGGKSPASGQENAQKQNAKKTKNAKELDAARRQSAELAQELKLQKCELAKVKKDLEETKKSSAIAENSAGLKVEECDEYKKKLGKVVREVLWHCQKFVRTPEEELAGGKVVIPLTKEYQDESPKVQGMMITTYKGNVKTHLNQHRSYVQSQMKDAALQFMDNGMRLPTVDQIMRCALREVSDVLLLTNSVQLLPMIYVQG
ncbi:MAG: hypothetical protein KJO73_12340 [Croceitalea sp.]|nr:hypothetical protein [Croceitalea sp.]